MRVGCCTKERTSGGCVFSLAVSGASMLRTRRIRASNSPCSRTETHGCRFVRLVVTLISLRGINRRSNAGIGLPKNRGIDGSERITEATRVGNSQQSIVLQRCFFAHLAGFQSSLLNTGGILGLLSSLPRQQAAQPST
jgi:hypothetical protein